MENEQFCIEHEGVLLEGKIVYRTGSDLSVRILRPYKNLSTGSHIPYFARPSFSYLGDYAYERAPEFLIELYELGLFLDQEFDRLKKRVVEKRKGRLDRQGVETFGWFFKKEFPMQLSYSLQRQVIDILDGIRPFRARVFKCSTCDKELLLAE